MAIEREEQLQYIQLREESGVTKAVFVGKWSRRDNLRTLTGIFPLPCHLPTG